MSTSNENHVAKVSREIPFELDKLNATVADLLKVVVAMNETLSPVLSLGKDADQVQGTKEPTQLCDIARRIYDIGASVERSVTELENLQRRVEL